MNLRRVIELISRIFFSLVLLTILVPRLSQAGEVFYDRYAALWPEGVAQEGPRSTEGWSSWSKHFLVYPFELIRWPIDKTLVFIEDHHLYDKVDWIYEEIKERGITPRLRGLAGQGALGGGFNIEFVQLAGLKEQHPHSTLKSSNLWTLDHITDHRVEVLQKGIAETGLFAGGEFRYENRGEEHFYGIGPNTSRGDGTSWRLERTTLAARLGVEWTEHWKLEGNFDFQNVNVTNGEDGGRGIIDEIFVASRRQPIPGLGGDEILSGGLALKHDTRDSEDLPTKGGYERLHFSYHKGMDSTTGFFRYRGEAARFFSLGTDRRIFALRAVVEHNDETGDREVPFFAMPRLGGYGTYPRIGDTHRGFKRDRFYDESLLLFNVEYRWAVWEYREWRMDSVLFCDLGQVFGEWSEFQMEDFRPSYGLGFRINFEGDSFLVIEIARSSEGTQFYVKTKTPF